MAFHMDGTETNRSGVVDEDYIEHRRDSWYNALDEDPTSLIPLQEQLVNVPKATDLDVMSTVLLADSPLSKPKLISVGSNRSASPMSRKGGYTFGRGGSPRSNRMTSPRSYANFEERECECAKATTTDVFLMDKRKQMTPEETQRHVENLNANYKLEITPGSNLQKTIQDLNIHIGRMVISPDNFDEEAETYRWNTYADRMTFMPKYKPEKTRSDIDLLTDAWFGVELEFNPGHLRFYDRLITLAQTCEHWEMFAQGCIRKFGGLMRMNVKLPDEGDTPGEVVPKNLMLRQNFFSGYFQLRLLDIKIGDMMTIPKYKRIPKSNGWATYKQDMSSNSVIEGLRAEICTNPGELMYDYLDAHDNVDGTNFIKNMGGVKQYHFQSMRIREVLPFFFDCRSKGEELWKGTERYIHNCIARIVRRLYRFCDCLTKVHGYHPILDSIISIGFDTDINDERRWDKIICRAGDWEESQIVLKDEHDALTDLERTKNEKVWKTYRTAANRLGWELTRYFVNRCLVPKWDAVVFEVMDFMNKKVVGMGFLPNLTEPDQEVELLMSKKFQSWFKSTKASLSVQVDHDGDGNYRVGLISIQGLPAKCFGRNQFMITCNAFQKKKDAEKYFSISEGKTNCLTIKGRAFSHPSRVFILDKKDTSQTQLRENFYFSTTRINPDRLQFDNDDVLKQVFSTNLRYVKKYQDPYDDRLEGTSYDRNGFFVQPIYWRQAKGKHLIIEDHEYMRPKDTQIIRQQKVETNRHRTIMAMSPTHGRPDTDMSAIEASVYFSPKRAITVKNEDIVDSTAPSPRNRSPRSQNAYSSYGYAVSPRIDKRELIGSSQGERTVLNSNLSPIRPATRVKNPFGMSSQPGSRDGSRSNPLTSVPPQIQEGDEQQPMSSIGASGFVPVHSEDGQADETEHPVIGACGFVPVHSEDGQADETEHTVADTETSAGFVLGGKEQQLVDIPVHKVSLDRHQLNMDIRSVGLSAAGPNDEHEVNTIPLSDDPASGRGEIPPYDIENIEFFESTGGPD